MAQSGAELRALVHANNQVMTDAQKLLYSAKDLLRDGAMGYRRISDKPTIEQAALKATQADDAVSEAITLIIQAIDSANTYASTV